MLWAIIVAGIIMVAAASLDSAYRGFDDEDDDNIQNEKGKNMQK